MLLALYLNQKVRGIRIIKSLFFSPFVVSGVVIGLVFSWFYDPSFGLLKVLIGHGVPVLGDEHLATPGIIVAALWVQIPFCMILFLTSLTGINPEVSIIIVLLPQPLGPRIEMNSPRRAVKDTASTT